MIEVELEKKISYAFNGEEQFCNKVILQEPRAIWAKQFAEIKKEINTAINIQREKEKNQKVENSNEQISNEEVGKVIMTIVSLNSNPVVIYSKFEELIKAGLIKVAETNVQFTSTMFDKLSLNDFNKIIEVYIGNFMKS